MSFPIGLHSISLGALVTLVLLLTVLAGEVFLDSSEVSKSSGAVVMDASRLGT